MRKIRILLLCTTLSATPIGQRRIAQAQSIDPIFAGIPNITFTYYDVAGRDERTIRESLTARRMTYEDGPAEGRTNWRITWSLRQKSGECRVVGTPVFSAEIILPRLENEAKVSPGVLVRWTEFISALRLHEAGHAQYAFDHVRDVEAALHGPTCDDANLAGAAAIKTISQWQVDYDRKTRHGVTQGVAFP